MVAEFPYHAIAHPFTADPISAYMNGFVSALVYQTVLVLLSLAFDDGKLPAALEAVTAVGIV